MTSNTEPPVLPGRNLTIAGFAVSNARQATRNTWGVRFGSSYYPDYARPHPTIWNGQHGGHYLEPEEAEEIAAGLLSAAAWARAQERLSRLEESRDDL